MNAGTLARLEAAAAEWAGTPFVANSAVRGAGVACHLLCGALYEQAGATTKLDLPRGSPVHGRAGRRPIMEEWLAGPGAAHFEAVPVCEVQPGDLLGFKVGTVVHHLAILLPGDRIAHAVQTHGARVVAMPTALSKRLVKAWRPKAIHAEPEARPLPCPGTLASEGGGGERGPCVPPA